ncbi:uncharacterized protein MONBRDRAFT_12617 [Monosiga brevicollis MX1]|uniref:Cation/H+ exchanger transmembrane domain-containing protein n=1 Tax=Monosiga brevicollis TaxID=81824 RepID=A9VCT4_MONBE|nr:uncharacterized protein MONBRDRAFT_12617 [Monosiga brevicollis MX1]EDQ84650.1 predicted protein [Monosiga brevicollis MX1]|eukprot:XP_001750554.1 hypothetical protein [Monosiga brevicollis MX1]
MATTTALLETTVGPSELGSTSFVPNATMHTYVDEHADCASCYLFIFLLLSMASYRIGQWASHLKMLALTGYLITGILAGPDILHILSRPEIDDLRFIDRLALALIAFTAGAELYLPHLYQFLPSLLRIVTATTIVGLVGFFVVAFVAAPLTDFMDRLSPGQQATVALLGAVISVASSPLATIAIINKHRAKGPYGQMALGVVLLKDAVVIVLYAVVVHVAFGVFTDDGRPDNGLIVLYVIGELILTVLIGLAMTPFLYALARLDANRLDQFARQRIFRGWTQPLLYDRFLAGNFQLFRGGLLLAAAYGLYEAQRALRDHASIHIQYSLACMTATATLINYKKDLRLMWSLHEMIQSIAPYVFTTFFTYVGMSFDFMLLGNVVGAAVLLFVVRIVCLFVGGYVGCWWANEPARHGQFAFLAMIMQAGAGMAYATFLEDEFHTEGWGPSFATMTVFMILLAQVIGPRTLKWALLHFKEAEKRRTRSLKRSADESDDDSDEDDDGDGEPYEDFMAYDPFAIHSNLVGSRRPSWRAHHS